MAAQQRGPRGHQSAATNKAPASSGPNLRALAAALLTRVHGGARLQPILAAACDRLSLPDTERAWLSELAYGVSRHGTSLDAACGQHLKAPGTSLPVPVRIVLRIGAYQLLYMRTPSHAAVKESVALVGKRFGRLRGVVNAVLRRLSESRGDEEAAMPLATLATVPEAADLHATGSAVVGVAQGSTAAGNAPAGSGVRAASAATSLSTTKTTNRSADSAPRAVAPKTTGTAITEAAGGSLSETPSAANTRAASDAGAPPGSTQNKPQASLRAGHSPGGQPRLDAANPHSVTWWSTHHSHPAWLVRAFLAALPAPEVEALLLANNERPLLWLRVNEHRATRDGVIRALRQAGFTAEPALHLPLAVVLPASGKVTNLPGFAEGHFSIQDGAAQAAGHLLAVPAGGTVLDACAAPGGKTTHLLAAVGPEGHVIAVDRHAPRLGRIAPEAHRLGHTATLQCRTLDLTDPAAIAELAASSGPFHYILLDAPCSGMGTLRRHPELRQRSNAHLQELGALQASLLASVSSLLAVGGRLVYAVCSPLLSEGAEPVAALCARRPELVARPVLPELSTMAASDGCAIATWPHRHGLDAFWAICLERRA